MRHKPQHTCFAECPGCAFELGEQLAKKKTDEPFLAQDLHTAIQKTKEEMVKKIKDKIEKMAEGQDDDVKVGAMIVMAHITNLIKQ